MNEVLNLNIVEEEPINLALDFQGEIMNPVTKKDIQDAVDQYFQENPISFEETDPTVSDWAKQPTKPTYTPSEIGAVPTTRKIANIDLKDNITVSELQEKLGTYPPVVFHREPEPRETELKGKVGQIGILTYSYNTKLKVYKCTDVRYTGSRYEYDWECINWLDGVHIDYTSGQFPENMNSGPAGTMVYKFNTKTLYFFNGSVWTEIPLNINLADSLDNATDDQIPTVKAVKDYVDKLINEIKIDLNN